MRALKFPKPKPDAQAYEETIRKGFERYPERLENFKKYEGSAKTAKLPYMPIKIDIEPVSTCNLKCEMCQVATFKNQKRSDNLSFGNYKEIIDAQCGIFEVKLQGLGEPFLHKDFVRMIEYASHKDIWVRTTTNATVLHRDDNYKRIVDAGIGEIQISVDGTTKETYEKIRKNAAFDKVMNNCRLINDYCDQKKTDKTRMWVLLQADNVHELDCFPPFAKENGFKRITISLDVNGWGDEGWTKKNTVKNISHKVTQGDVDRLLRKAKELSIDLTFWDITTKYTRENLCPWPFERTYISSDNKVVPCCMIANPDIFNFGMAGDFNNIWGQHDYQVFRESHIKGNIPDICQFCYVN